MKRAEANRERKKRKKAGGEEKTAGPSGVEGGAKVEEAVPAATETAKVPVDKMEVDADAQV